MFTVITSDAFVTENVAQNRPISSLTPPLSLPGHAENVSPSVSVTVGAVEELFDPTPTMARLPMVAAIVIVQLCVLFEQLFVLTNVCPSATAEHAMSNAKMRRRLMITSPPAG
jgi:hypothetical protein